MIKNLLLPFAGVAVFIIIVGVLIKNPEKFGLKRATTVKPTPSIGQITVGGKTVNVTLADTDVKRVKGLSGVSYLPGDAGMLFTYDTKGIIPKFWMKGMLIPLDMIWISGGKIVNIDRSVPVPDRGTPENKLPVYGSPVPVDYVLEVNSGFSSLNNIEVGDSVIIP
jgi:hypothetical protein